MRLTDGVREDMVSNASNAAKKFTFQVHLGGVIQLLAQNLYSKSDIFLREMIQNAHDSTVRRRYEHARTERATELPAPRIQVVPDAATGTIAIHDNGCGLTRTEVDTNLSTIGRSGTHEFRNRIERDGWNGAVELIGQFGIGLLSAFIVAERVVVVTRAEGQAALRWECDGGETYTVTTAERDYVGTTVTLHLSAQHREYTSTDRLRGIIRTYADLIGTPVYLGGEAVPANAVTAPWDETADASSELVRQRFWQRRFPNDPPQHLIPVDEAITWDDLSLPGGTGRGRVRGLLGIPQHQEPQGHALGTADVYVSRMYVAGGHRGALPAWAQFVTGVVDCPQLSPNAARDGVMEDVKLAAVRQALGDLLVRELIGLADSAPELLDEILSHHARSLLTPALQPEREELFRAIADHVPMPIPGGSIPFAEYLATAPPEDGRRVVHYVTDEQSGAQFAVLAAAHGIRLLVCADPLLRNFLKRYGQMWPRRVRLSLFDDRNARALFVTPDQSVEGTEDFRIAAQDALREHRVTVSVSSFQPVYVPAVVHETRQQRQRQALAGIARNEAVPENVRRIVGDVLDDPADAGTMELNAANPLIQLLMNRRSQRDEITRHVLVALLHGARRLTGRASTAVEEQEFAQTEQSLIKTLLTLDARLQQARPSADEPAVPHPRHGEALLDDYISCFVAMPFRDPRAAEIYTALRDVLEDAPFFWRVVRADDSVEKPGLWANLKEKLLRAHCSVAILGKEINANVMIEIGRMEAIERPLLLLRDAGAPTLPVDLQGLLFEDLRAHGADLVDEVRHVMVRQTQLAGLTGKRYLSPRVLQRHAALSPEVSERISRLYPSWDDFFAADAAQIATTAGLPEAFVTPVKQQLAGLIPKPASRETDA